VERDISGPTDRNDQNGQRGPPSKLVPNIQVGPNRNDPFHLMNQPKFPELGVEWKAPQAADCYTCIICRFLKVVDFLSMTAANRRKGPSTVDKGWYQVAWAFLKVSLMVPARQTVGDLSGLRCLGPVSTIKISRKKFSTSHNTSFNI